MNCSNTEVQWGAQLVRREIAPHVDAPRGPRHLEEV
jgi:hypothetical protein